GAPVQRVQYVHARPVRIRRDAAGRAGAPRAAGRLLPGQARPLPRTAGRHPAAAAAGAGRLLPTGRLFGRQRPGRCRVLPLADGGEGRGRDSAVAVLRLPARRPAPGAAVLRQERGDPGRGDRAAARTLAGWRGGTATRSLDHRLGSWSWTTCAFP